MASVIVFQIVVARATKRPLTDSENTMFCRIICRVRRECFVNQGSFDRPSDIGAMSAVSIAAPLPAACAQLTRDPD